MLDRDTSPLPTPPHEPADPAALHSPRLPESKAATRAARCSGSLRQCLWQLLERKPLQLGWLLCGLLVALLAVVGWVDHEGVMQDSREQSLNEARMLENHASRLLDTVAVTSGYLAQQMRLNGLGEKAALGSLLERQLQLLPYVSSFYLVDGAGRVIASTVPSHAGQQVDLSRLGRLPAPERDQFGGYLSGTWVLDHDAESTSAEQASYIPLTHALSEPGAGTLYLIALIRPRALMGYPLRSLSRGQAQAFWMTPSGEVLASLVGSEDAHGVATREIVAKPAVPVAWGLSQRSGQGVGQGVGGGYHVMAYQSSMNRPLTVLVQRPYAQVLRQWGGRMLPRALVTLGLIAGILYFVRVLRHNVQQRLAVQADLNALREASQRREQRLYTLVKGVQSVVLRTDAAGVVQYANDRWSDGLGMTAELPVGQPLVHLFDPATRPQVLALLACTDGTVRRACEVSRTDARGRVRHFDLTLAPVSARNECGGFVCTLVDTTDRVDARRALRQQLQVANLCLDVNPLPVLTTDTHDRITYVNRAWEEFTGLSRADVQARRSGDVLGEAQTAFRSALQEELLASGGGSVSYETRMVHRDGRQRDVVVTQVVLHSALTADGTAGAGTLSTLLDVSEYRAAERSVQEAKDTLEAAQLASSGFTSHVTQQLKSPLQTILGFAELGLGKSDLPQPPLPTLHTMFRDIHDAGLRMQAMVDDLLDLSNLESGVESLQPERADLRALVYPVLRELQAPIARKQLVICKELGITPLMVSVDTHWMHKALRHTMVQMLQYSAEASTLVLSAEDDDEGSVVFKLTEVHPEVQAADGNPLLVGAQATTTPELLQALDQGLALSRKIVEAHGGHIDANACSEQGVCFEIKLPRYRRFKGLADF